MRRIILRRRHKQFEKRRFIELLNGFHRQPQHPVEHNCGALICLLKKAFENLAHLDQLWQEASAESKRLIIGSIFPEELVFDGSTFQTARLIYLLNKGLGENKNGQNRIWEDLRLFVDI